MVTQSNECGQTSLEILRTFFRGSITIMTGSSPIILIVFCDKTPMASDIRRSTDRVIRS